MEIISPEATRESIKHRGIPRVKREILEVPEEIERLKADLAQATGANQKAEIEGNIRQAQDYLNELQAMELTLPGMTFDRSLILQRPTRSVQIICLGKAHTDGDVVVYLPKEKVIITGDFLQGWLPYMRDGYPYDWIKSLEEAMKLDFDYIIGGHGDVMRGKGQCELLKSYLIDLMAHTAEANARGETMADVEKNMAVKLHAKYAGKFPSGMFAQGITGNIQKAYRVVSGATQ